jgi:hypothetical protein
LHADKITLDIAEETLVKLAYARIERTDITKTEKTVLQLVVKMKECAVSELSHKIEKSAQYAGKLLSKLLHMRKEGRTKIYLPSLDAIIAYSQLES